MFLTTKTNRGGHYLTQLHLTLNNDKVQTIIESTVEDVADQKILTTIFNQLMEKNETNISKQMATSALKNARANEMATMNEIILHVLVHFA